MASKVAIKKQEHMAKLNAYDMDGSASKKMLMRTVKDMFEKRVRSNDLPKPMA